MNSSGGFRHPYGKRREYIGFPAQHRGQLCTTNPIERLNKEIKRLSEVGGLCGALRRGV
jgi:transposase-like protein